MLLEGTFNHNLRMSEAVPGKFLGIVVQDPSDSNLTSNMLTSSGFR